MSSYRQPKAKTTKPKDTTSRTIHKQSVSNTLTNSRSLTKIYNPQKSKKIIPKILSKIEKNVQDLKKYCSDLTPNTSRRTEKRKQSSDKVVKTSNNPCQETTASVDQIKKGYLSVYGKETENIIELWKFYNSSINRGNKRTSLTAYSVSIPLKSQIGPDYSLQSRTDESGVHSAMSSIRVPLQSINLSDLMTNSNRPSGIRARPQILQNVIYQQEQECRPLQRIRLQPQRQIRNINFSLRSELDLSNFTKRGQISKDKSTIQDCKDLSFGQKRQRLKDNSINQKSQIKNVSMPPSLSDQTSSINVKLEEKSKQENKKLKLINLQQQIAKPQDNKNNIFKQKQQTGIRLFSDFIQNSNLPLKHQMKSIQLTTPTFDKDQSRRIFQKNMLINKRKQQLNAKLKKGTKATIETKDQIYNVPVIEFALDQAIIIEEDKPAFANDLPLSKQDISLLEKLDQIDKQICVSQQQNTQNCVFEALKDLKRKKKFQKSKYVVAEIPIRRAKKPMVVDFIEQQNIQINFQHLNIQRKKLNQKQKQRSNSSLLDCQIQGVEGEDSLLQNFQGIDIDL